MENEKYYTGGENNSLNNNLILKIANWRNSKTPSFETTWLLKSNMNSFEEGNLKNVDINSMIESLYCSWIKWSYDDKFYEWTIQRLLHFVHFRNNFSVTGTSSFLLMLLFHLPFYHNQIDMKKILNPFTLKN